MKQSYMVFDNAGEIVETGFGFPPEGAILIDRSQGSRAPLYIDGENGWAERPSLEPISQDGNVITFGNYPEGSVIKVVDIISDEVMAEIEITSEYVNEPLQITDSGEYLVSVEPPMPFLPFQGVFLV